MDRLQAMLESILLGKCNSNTSSNIRWLINFNSSDRDHFTRYRTKCGELNLQMNDRAIPDWYRKEQQVSSQQ